MMADFCRVKFIHAFIRLKIHTYKKQVFFQKVFLHKIKNLNGSSELWCWKQETQGGKVAVCLKLLYSGSWRCQAKTLTKVHKGGSPEVFHKACSITHSHSHLAQRSQQFCDAENIK